MTFELLNRIAALIMGLLALALLLTPGLIHWLFAIDSSAGADVMSRRAAMLFAGLVALVYLSRETVSLEVQHVVSAVMTVAMAGLFALGLFEWVRGAVGAGIALALIVEAAFVYCYFGYWQE